MDGLIPMVFRTFKRGNTRRQYEPLSSSGAAAQHSYNIADFYPNGYDGHQHMAATPEKIDTDRSYGQQRRKSFNSREYAAGGDQNSNRQLVRFRSHRMFSCVTGGGHA